MSKVQNREFIKDGLLYTSSLMILITIFSNFFEGIYIQDSRLVFIDYFIFGIAICIIHLLSDKISLYLSSSILKKSIENKKPFPRIILILPWMMEITIDLIVMVVFANYSVNIMFNDIFTAISIIILIRLLNGLIDGLINALSSRRKVNEKRD